MNNGVINDLKSLAAELSKKLSYQDKFFTGVLAARLTKAAQDYPSDHTINGIAAFLSRRASVPGGHLISRGELIDIYNKLYTSNTKCAKYLEKELNKKTDVELIDRKVAGKSVEDKQIDLSKYADEKLQSVLESVLLKDKSAPVIPSKLAKEAIDISSKALPGKPITIEALLGDEDTILVRATYRTPKGNSSVIVPVEFVNTRALLPSVFLSRAGFVQISENALQDHLIDVAGKQFVVDASKIFNLIKEAKGSIEPINEVERIVVLAKSRAGSNILDNNGIINQAVDQESMPIKCEASEESISFAEKLSNPAGIAEFVHGKDVVSTAKSNISSALNKLGYSKHQLKVIDADDKKIVIAVNVLGSAFKVISKVESGKALYPTAIIANGAIESFSPDNIKKVAASGDRALASILNGYNLDNPNMLIENVREACYEKDLVKAAEVLDALYSTGDEKAFKIGFALYQQAAVGSSPISKKASVKQQIKTVKIGGNEVCAVTGLPVDKVYVDENGVVQAKHRENMSQTSSGFAGGFMNAKILMGM